MMLTCQDCLRDVSGNIDLCPYCGGVLTEAEED